MKPNNLYFLAFFFIPLLFGMNSACAQENVGSAPERCKPKMTLIAKHALNYYKGSDNKIKIFSVDDITSSKWECSKIQVKMRKNKGATVIYDTKLKIFGGVHMEMVWNITYFDANGDYLFSEKFEQIGRPSNSGEVQSLTQTLRGSKIKANWKKIDKIGVYVKYCIE